MIKIFILVLIVGCAHEKVSLPESAKVFTKDFPSAKEAINSVINKRNYLQLLFEQSRDPYYGTPKWPEECLKQNTFDKLQHENGNSLFIAHLILNEKGDAGHCQGNETEIIYLHCKDEAKSHEIHCPPGSCQGILRGNPCPIKN